jgi:cell division control protein 11
MRKLLSISSGRQVQRRPNIEHTSLDSLREIDIELMRRLSPRVNVIPVIGRADSLTPQELRDFKRRIMEDIEHYNIPIYNFPYDPEEDDEDTVEENSELRVSIFF